MARRGGTLGAATAVTALVQVMAGAPVGGAEAFFVRLAGALQRAGQAQHVVIRRNEARALALRGDGVGVTELGFGGRLDLATPFRLNRVIRDHHPEIVLSWMNRASAVVRPGAFEHAARLGGYYDLKYYRRARHLIGNTRDIVSHIVSNGWPAERAHYLPNFVDAAPVPKLSRVALDTKGEAIVLLALGRLHRVKGFDVLLHAVERMPRIVLWLAGEGPERAALETLAGRLGIADRVRFLGWRDDTAALLAAADIVVVPSRSEPLGNVVIEAWARSIPVIATATQGPAALIRPGETGLLVPVEDAAAIVHSVETLTQHPALRESLVAAGHEAYAAEFTEPAVVAQYQDFFQRVRR